MQNPPIATSPRSRNKFLSIPCHRKLRQINLVRFPEEPVNCLHYYVQTSFGSPVKSLALSLPINRPESEAGRYLLQTFPCDEFYIRTLTRLHDTLYTYIHTYIYGQGHFVIFWALSTLSSIHEVHFFLSLFLCILPLRFTIFYH